MVHLEDPEAWPELERQMLGGGELAAALGGRFMVLIDDTYSNLFTGEPTRPSRLDDDGWKRLIDATHRAADLAATRLGLQLVYHPHAETHVEYEDQIEAFLEQTDPSRVSLCLDTGHHAYRGGDPGRVLPPTLRPHPLSAPEERRPRRSRSGSNAIGSPSPSPWPTTCSASRTGAPSTSSPSATRSARPTTTAGRRSSRTCTRALRQADADRPADPRLSALDQPGLNRGGSPCAERAPRRGRNTMSELSGDPRPGRRLGLGIRPGPREPGAVPGPGVRLRARRGDVHSADRLLRRCAGDQAGTRPGRRAGRVPDVGVPGGLRLLPGAGRPAGRPAGGAARPGDPGAGLVAADRGRGTGRAPAAGRGTAVRLPAGASVPLRPVPGRRLPRAGPRRGRLDAGDRARLRPGVDLDVQPAGRCADPVPARLALPGLRELAGPVRANRRPGHPVVRGVLALVPRSAGGDAPGQPRRAEAHRGRAARSSRRCPAPCRGRG